MDIDQKLNAAEERAAKSARYRDKLLIIKTAEAEIPSIWDAGQNSMAQLAENYGISPMTVRRILQDAGREIHRFRKLDDEERAEIISHLKGGVNPDELAAAYQVSKATIRRVGMEGGLIRQTHRKPRRTDEDYLMIQAFDEECRARFEGSGLYNLGMGLRNWKRKKQAEARILAEANAAPPPEPSPEPAPEPAPAADPDPQPEAPPVVYGDGAEDAAAVVGPFANQAEQKPGFNF